MVSKTMHFANQNYTKQNKFYHEQEATWLMAQLKGYVSTVL